MVAAALLATSCGASAAEPKMSVSAPWTLATPESAKVAGGFLTLSNTGKAADRLVRAETDVSQSVEIHEMQLVNGNMMMRPHGAGITVKPGKSVTLKPFSHHLMLMDINRQLKAGETVKGKLFFEKSPPMDVVFTVEPLGYNGPKIARSK